MAPVDISMDNYDFFKLRKEGKIYFSKVFNFPNSDVGFRNINFVFENSVTTTVGEIDGVLTLHQSEKRKQQVCILAYQHSKSFKSITLQRFEELKSGDYISRKEHSFTLSISELTKVFNFLKSLKYIDFSNTENFQIEDISTNNGNKVVIDSTDKGIIDLFKSKTGDERFDLLNKIKNTLTRSDIDILLGRKEALEVFKSQLDKNEWNELDWQLFFEKESWIFGYGLDYRFMTQFDREVNVSAAGTDNKEKSKVDFLMTFNDFTVTVEIKRPDTKIFGGNNKNRSGCSSFHKHFIDAVSQVLEQKAEWTAMAHRKDNYNSEGTSRLEQRTKDPKSILIIGNKKEFLDIENVREREIKQDTFELFRRDSRNLEILTYDELYARACFIVNQKV